MKIRVPALVLLLVCASPAAAQNVAQEGDAEVCENGRITHIFIDNHSIFDTSDPELDARLEWAYDLANGLHRRTQPEVIRRELVFHEGDCFEPRLLEESERLLRALGFLSDVDVFAVPQDGGDHHVIVDTQDEWSTKVEVQVDVSGGIGFDGARVQEANLLGTGRTLELFYLDRRLAREYGAAYATPQLFGTRWDFAARIGDTRAGTFFEQSLSFPFVGEVGRWALRQSFRRNDRYFDLVAAGEPPASSLNIGPEIHLLLPMREKGMDIGVVRRFGRPGGLSLIGGGLSFQEVTYPGGRAASLLVAGSSFEDSTTALQPYLDPVWTTLEEVQNIRAFVVLGHRSIGWSEQGGLDAFAADQDVRVGSEVGLALGRSLAGLEEADDLFTTLTLFTGFLPHERLVLSAESRMDARRDFDAPVDEDEWRDVIADGRLLAYWRPPGLERHTLVGRLTAAAGWANVVPFQLTLGGRNALRGYDDWRFPGGRRVVLTLEDRVFVGWPFPDFWDIGLTGHVDVGRVWPGELAYPYGIDSGWRASGGVGLRGNFPAGGRTTYRLDIATPLDAFDLGATRIIISVGEPIGLGRFDRREIDRSRLSGVSSDVFNFPR